MRTLFGFRRAGIAIACTSVAFACSDRSPTQPPNPSSILLVSGDQQQAVVANALNEPIVVRVLDEKNQVEAGVTVSFVAAEGAGTVHPQEAKTDADGIARTIWIVGTSTRVDQTLQARVENRLGPALVTTFHAKALPGPATALAIGTEPTTATVSGAPLYVQPSVLLVDRYGNVVPLSGVRVLATLVGPTSESLSGTVTAFTNAHGVAQFAGLTITGPPASVLLAFTSPPLSALLSSHIDLVP